MTTIRHRRGTAAQWSASSRKLAEGEIGYETDTQKFKMGDGVSNWSDLDYFVNEDALTDLIGRSLDPVIPDAMRPTTTIHTAAAPMVAHACAEGMAWAPAASQSGTITLDATDHVLLGSRSVRIVTNGQGGSGRVDAPLAIDMTGKQPVVWLRYDDIAKAGTCDLFLGSSATFAANFRFPIVASNATGRFPRSGEWVKMVLPWGAAVVTGTPSRSAITHARLSISDKGGDVPVTVHFAGLAVQAESPLYPRGVCVFGFDDGRASIMRAKRILDRYGFAATNYPIAERVDQGTAGFGGGTWTTYADLEAQQTAGWEIAQHAYTVEVHDALGGFTAFSAERLAQEFTLMKRWAAKHGFKGGDHVAYPQGFHDNNVLACSKRFFSSGRSVMTQTKESFPPADPYRVRMADLGGNTTMATAKAHIDAAIAGKGMAVFMGHEVSTAQTGGSLDWSEANYAELIAYAASSGIDVRTMGQAMRGV